MQDFNAQDVTIPSEVFDSLRRAAAPTCRTFKACDITTTLEVFESLCQCSGSEGAGRSTRRPCPSRPRSLFRRAGQWQRFFFAHTPANIALKSGAGPRLTSRADDERDAGHSRLWPLDCRFHSALSPSCWTLQSRMH